MAVKLLIPGQPLAAPRAEPLLGLVTTELTAFGLTPAARSAAVGQELEVEVDDDAVLELEIEGGFSVWTSAAQYREDLAEARPEELGRGGGAVRVYALPQPGLATRGIVDWVLKGLKVFRIDPVGAAATATARAITRAVENQLKPAPGLYRCADPKTLGEPVTEPLQAPPGTPVLVLLHGTASSTEGSFGALSDPGRDGEWRQLLTHFGDQIYAFQRMFQGRFRITHGND